MFPVAGVPWDGSSRRLDAAPWKPGALHAPGCTCEACAGLVRGSICQAGVLDPQTGKLSSPPSRSTSWRSALTMCWPRQIGSKRLPLKAHAAWEPVIPAARHRLGRRRLGARQAHQRSRPPPRALLRALRLRAHRRSPRPERVAQVLNAEMQELKTQHRTRHAQPVDTLSDPTMADRFEAALGRPIVATSLQG